LFVQNECFYALFRVGSADSGQHSTDVIGSLPSDTVDVYDIRGSPADDVTVTSPADAEDRAVVSGTLADFDEQSSTSMTSAATAGRSSASKTGVPGDLSESPVRSILTWLGSLPVQLRRKQTLSVFTENKVVQDSSSVISSVVAVFGPRVEL